MKRKISFLVACIMIIGSLAGCGGGNNASSSGGNTNTASTTTSTPDTASTPGATDTSDMPVVKIGVFEPLSGDNGAGGKQEKLGMEYANTLAPTVNIGGVEHKVELVVADNQSATDKAPSAAQSLVSAGVSLVLGSYGSAVSIAAHSVFDDARMPAIGVSCTNPSVTIGNDFYYRICFLDPFQGTVLANFASEHFGAEKAYVLAKQGDDYSMGLANFFMSAFEGETIFETFPEGTSDFSSYVASAKTHGADAFFSPVSSEAAALIIDQAATQDLGMPILAGDTWDAGPVVNAFKGKNLDLYITTFYQSGGNPEFDNGFRDWINANPQAKTDNGGNDIIAAVSALGFDAYNMALKVLETAGSTDPAVILPMIGSVSITGVTGPIAFDDANGDALRDTAFVIKANTEAGIWDFVAQQSVK